ncbi:MAG: polyprenyl diphosphate synthase [Betaproteobacteria bacterium]|nr:polyprenyl diphosphate synthase [Betaproteobacteria bacterium]
MNSPDHDKLPGHVAIVMDGNGRWARQRGLPRTEGHRRGIQAVRKVVAGCARRNIARLTLFAFSTENWSRPKAEISTLFKLFAAGIRDNLKEMGENGVQVKFVGQLDRFGAELGVQMRRMEEETAANSSLLLTVALNYSGRWDIVNAVQRLAASGCDCTQVTEQLFERELAVPPADLVIRTSGEMRLSNFLLWQSAYAELHFCPSLWPDFAEDDLDAALADYAGRERRYGGIGTAALPEQEQACG